MIFRQKKTTCSSTEGNSDAEHSTSGHAVAAKTSTVGAFSEESESTEAPNKSNQKGNGLQTTRHVGLPVRVCNGNLLVTCIMYPDA